MAQRWRVGEGGLRVITTRGTYSLPAGAVLDEIPAQYEGKLTVIEWGDEPKRMQGYADKRVRPESDKSYLVGESGPELFTPTQQGTIIHNKDLPK